MSVLLGGGQESCVHLIGDFNSVKNEKERNSLTAGVLIHKLSTAYFKLWNVSCNGQ